MKASQEIEKNANSVKQPRFRGYLCIVKDLIAKGADVNICDDEGLSPLYLACFSEQTEVVKILLEHGADVHNSSPLCMMCEIGNSEIVRILLNNGADVNLCSDEGLNPLYFACFYNHVEIVKISLKHGADVNIASPLWLMCKFGNAEIVRLVLNNDANVNLCNFEVLCPLYLAWFSHQSEIVEMLLEYGAE